MITNIETNSQIQKTRFNKKSFCQPDKSPTKISAIDFAGAVIPNETNITIKGRKKGMLFRRGIELARAFLPSDVLSSQYASIVTPATISARKSKSDPAGEFIDCMIESRTSIGISFQSLENETILYYISCVFSRETKYGHISYRRTGQPFRQC